MNSLTQMVLNLTLRADATLENFYPGQNQWIINNLRSFCLDADEPYIYLWGTAGSGRTHLLQACCHEVSNSIYFDLSDHSLTPLIFTNLEKLPLVCLDNVEVVAGHPDWELALFNFYNHSRELNARLLIAGAAPPAQLLWKLQDLSSRLAWGLVMNVQSLTDDQKLSVLQLRAKERGFELPAEVGEFLLNHHPRNMNCLLEALDQLDHEGMVAKRRITIPFVKQVLRL